MRRRLAAVLALTALMWLPTTVTGPAAVHAASTCTGWTSTRVPPPTIRVLRTSGPSSGHVQTVNFKSYVQIVLAAEWPSSWPASTLQTGAIATKQYGWYFTMHYRGGTAHGACYDVADNTNDQIYQPESRTPSAGQLAAINATWNESLTKNGSFLMTGYRSGANGLPCGADADGSHLFQHSSVDCANQGMTADEILHVYLDPGLATWRPATDPAAIFFSPAVQSQVTVGSSATVAWTEELTAGTTITARNVTLMMALPQNGSCAVDRWLPGSPAWQSTGASPQTVTGLKTGYCYRFVVALTDSTNVTTRTLSGPMLVDPAAPSATFTSPAPNVVTAIGGLSATVRWTETPTPGTHIVSRRLVTERAAQPAAGTCAGAQWSTLRTTTSASPVSSTGLLKLYCYRYRLVLTDSAGHKSTTVSGDLKTPAA
ncbi:MAG: SpoIID/LytB domain-containing protein [Candidatus Limnocylindrales bacterium]|jgi:hypothetical protein